MSSIDRPRAIYNVARIVADMTERGWTNRDLARRAKVSDMVVSRFLRGQRQTAPTVKKLAKALGYSVRRYLVAVGERVAS